MKPAEDEHVGDAGRTVVRHPLLAERVDQRVLDAAGELAAFHREARLRLGASQQRQATRSSPREEAE